MMSTTSVSKRIDSSRFGRQQPHTLSLSVGLKEEIFWDMKSDTFVFDDSFVHSVTYSNEEEPVIDHTTAHTDGKSNENFQLTKDLARTVLIVDLWHPNLQDMEKLVLQHSYPPFSSIV
mmetsp:Transcript_9333/g.22664  ORF Transcript_9333/g.22664 Transcript_9333/m.22664 type:complete len:118 (+) Transcript_9333:1-354(+)